MAELINEQKPDYETARKKALLFGLIGADRRYIGDTGLANGKLALTICTLGIYCVPWWIIDFLIITKHKNDWDSYIASRRAVQAKKQAVKQAVADQRALVAERKVTGKCPKCGSDKLQVITETRSTSGSQGSRGCICCLIPSIPAVSGKTTATNKRMCMNCGNKF